MDTNIIFVHFAQQLAVGKVEVHFCDCRDNRQSSFSSCVVNLLLVPKINTNRNQQHNLDRVPNTFTENQSLVSPFVMSVCVSPGNQFITLTCVLFISSHSSHLDIKSKHLSLTCGPLFCSLFDFLVLAAEPNFVSHFQPTVLLAWPK